MPFPIWQKWLGEKPSGSSLASGLLRPAVASRDSVQSRSQLRVGIPRALNVWSTHQFWIGCLTALGIAPENIVFSSETSEDQYREFGRGRGAVDCCHPVKCMSGHYGELVFGRRENGAWKFYAQIVKGFHAVANTSIGLKDNLEIVHCMYPLSNLPVA